MSVSSRESLKRALQDLYVAERECVGLVDPETLDRLGFVKRCLEEQLFGALPPDEFRRLRQAAGLSQEALARRLDRTLRQVARYEQGHTPVPYRIADRLREFAKVEREPSGS